MTLPLRARLALLAAALLVACPRPAPAQAIKPLPFDGTHAFRRLLHNLGMKPLARDKAFYDDPARALLIFLGEGDLSETVWDLPGFLEKGGAALIATDRELVLQYPADGPLVMDMNVTGIRVTAMGSETCYKGIADCPLIQPAGDANLPLFRGTLGPDMRRLLLKDVATNKPSSLAARRLPPGLHVVAQFPPGCLWGGIPRRTAVPFAIGGKFGPGRLLVLADHSVFINNMLLQADNDNIAFAYNCIDWLTEGPPRRDKVLFVEDGKIQSVFDIPFKEVPIPLPPLEALVPAVNNALADLDNEDAFNGLLLNAVPLPVILAAVAVVSVLALITYGLYRLAAARHRVDLGAPPLATLLDRQTPAGSLLTRRYQALLDGGNLWEPARALVRQALETAGARGGRGTVAEPRFEVSGGWWQRWRGMRRLRRLWRIAYGARPVRVPPREFALLLRELSGIEAALAGGTWRLTFSPGTST
jgi:hypothetical protein